MNKLSRFSNIKQNKPTCQGLSVFLFNVIMFSLKIAQLLHKLFPIKLGGLFRRHGINYYAGAELNAGPNAVARLDF